MKLLRLLRNQLIYRECSFAVGSELRIKRHFSQEEVDKFCSLTEDQNPVHSITTPKEERCVPGAFLNAVVAGLIGTRFPGSGTLVLSQNFCFPKPCRLDTEVEITLKVLQHRKISIVSFQCSQLNRTVLEGEAKLLINK